MALGESSHMTGNVSIRRVVLSFDNKNVREMMIGVNFIDEVLHYLKSRKKLYRWAVFYHTVDDYCQWTVPHHHYHLLLWYEPGHGSAYYFSNVPFMQFVRRKCREKNFGHIKAYNIINIRRRMHILNCEKDGHEAYQVDMSCIMPDVEDTFRSKVQSE